MTKDQRLLSRLGSQLTQDPLSLRVGEELDRGELGNGSVLNRVGVLVIHRLGSEIFLLRTNVDGPGSRLDVAGCLSVSTCLV